MTPGSQNQPFTEVDFGGQKVTVPADGYCDRYQMNPDLNEVARNPAAGNIDFFRRFPKQMVPTRIGWGRATSCASTW